MIVDNVKEGAKIINQIQKVTGCFGLTFLYKKYFVFCSFL